jgi:hypothetical protein
MECRRQIEKSPLGQIEMSLSAASVGGIGPMTVITMSRTEIDRMGVLHDLADGRIKIAEASRLMGLGRRQVFRLAKAYGKHGPEALVSRRRGRPSNRCYPTALRTEVIGIIKNRYSDFGPTLAAENRPLPANLRFTTRGAAIAARVRL